VLITLQQRQKHLNRFLRVADEPHLNRSAQTDTLRIGVDLETTAVAWFWQIFDVWIRRTDHEQRVALLQCFF
jgi:hypothetical protein